MDASSSKFCHRPRAEQFLGDSQAGHFNSFPQGPQGCPTTQISARQLLPAETHPQEECGRVTGPSKGDPQEPWDKQQFLQRRTQELCSHQRKCHRALETLESASSLSRSSVSSTYMKICNNCHSYNEKTEEASFSNELYIAVIQFGSYSSKNKGDQNTKSNCISYQLFRKEDSNQAILTWDLKCLLDSMRDRKTYKIYRIQGNT